MAATVQIVLGVESSEMQDGLQARIHDPLWLLARQWQFGEFKGEDTGSPAAAQIVVESSPIARYRSGAGASRNAVQPYAPGAVPLETLVEREAVTSDRVLGWRGAAEAGLHLARLLRAAEVDTVATLLAGSALALAPESSPARRPDSRSQRLLSVVGARVVDGTRLHARLAPLHARGALADVFQDPPFDEVAPGNRQKVERALTAWMAWYAARFSEGTGAPAWVPERLEYEFAVAANASDGECVLAAPEYLGGHLDWYSFVAQPGASLGAAEPVATVATAFLPSPVSYRGMPSPRLWEFEDGSINFARVEASPGDLGRLLLLQFAIEYGHDWFLVPLEIDAGSLSRVASLVVTNTFGERLLVPHAGEVDGAASPWRMFTITGDERRFLFLPPALGQSLQSAPIEDVLFLRDEMANVAWAVERVVQGESGRAVDRFEAYQELRRLGPEAPVDAPSGEAARYELGTSVPDYWIPLLPVQVGSSLHLRRGVLGLETTAGMPVAQGRILEPGRELLLHDEEVPREGARVSRAYPVRAVDRRHLASLDRPAQAAGTRRRLERLALRRSDDRVERKKVPFLVLLDEHENPVGGLGRSRSGCPRRARHGLRPWHDGAAKYPGHVIAIGGLSGPAAGIAADREDGTLLRAKATPNGMLGYLVGKIVMFASTTLLGSRRRWSQPRSASPGARSRCSPCSACGQPRPGIM